MLDAIGDNKERQSLSERQKMHKYVLVCAGVFVLFVASFPLAYWRVSRSGKFNAGPFNTLTPEQSQKSQFEN
ncbi:hypothetical protein [Roseofilum casamattae]|uniref:Uncharacterized protein n=1 Tax=Roseofilum casamattae BLCC-M143 TaxID=3022442 RepID=A0ABT7C237_9CYAN|nr:hypothetical protein [Roseofilum casamattae]MDJ1185523.1 hypothetical protein [Roseofilum casamattae BLCC-M143]